MVHKFAALLLFLFASMAVFGQEVNAPPRNEIRFDLLPIIVTGSTNNNVGLGMEVFFTPLMFAIILGIAARLLLNAIIAM